MRYTTAAAKKEMPVSKGKMANVTKFAGMGKTVQVKGVKTAGSKLHLKGTKMASVRQSKITGKPGVKPSKVVGKLPGKNMPVSKSKMANVTKAG